jgi:predicted permease
VDARTAPIAGSDPRNGPNTLPFLDDVRDVLYPVGRPVVQLLLAAAGLVLLIGCANLANMLVARNRRRERDSGVRVALGASRAQLMRPVLFESLLIGLAGAALAVIMTSLTFDALLVQIPRVVYGNAAVGIDRRILLFALSLGVVGSVLFAIVPAWRSSRADALTLLASRQATGVPKRRFGRPMVGLQVAVSVVLVFGAIVAGRAFVAVLRVPLGFDPENVMSLRVRALGATGLERRAYVVGIVDALRARPDVVAAGAVSIPPLTGGAPDEGTRERTGGLRYALPGYLEATGMRMLRGRSLEAGDLADGTAAVASESFARAALAGRDPIGATFENSSGRRFIVVGVVADVKNSFDASPGEPLAFILPADRAGSMTMMVRMKTRRDVALEDVKRQVAALAPGTPATVDWWSDSLSRITAYQNPRFQTIVLGAFGVIALALTAIGIFGVVAFLVASRMREMGIRLAIGASPGRLVRSTMVHMLWPVALGLVAGAASTRWLAKLAESQLVRLDTHDPVTLAIAGVTVLAAALAAAYLPARHAAKVNPIVVLRAE